MKDIPQSCQSCGAPITWDEVSFSITREFCGAITYIRSKFVIIEKVKGSAYITFLSKSGIFDTRKYFAYS